MRSLPHPDPATALFAESTGRFVVEVRPDDVERLVDTVGPVHRIGVVTAEPVLTLPDAQPIPVADLVAAYTGADA